MRHSSKLLAMCVLQLFTISAAIVLMLGTEAFAQSRAKPITSAEASVAERGADAETQPEPTTAARAQAVLDLMTLSRINQEHVFEESPTYVNYRAKASLAAADAFYQATLETVGWKPAGPKPYVTDDYADRLFDKSGYFLGVRLAKSENRTMISLSHLGNVDVRRLPRYGNTELAAESTPVNLTYTTKISMAEALKFCRDQLVAQGWKEVQDPSDPGVDVPHVKMAYFRKNDVRVHAVICRIPQKLEEGPTLVTWSAMPMAAPDVSKPPVADIAENRPPRGPSQSTAAPLVEADDPSVPVPAGEDDDDLAARIQCEVKGKLERELKKLGTDLGDLGLDDLGEPAKPKLAAGSPNRKPAIKHQVDNDERRESPTEKASATVYYQAGPCKGYLSLGEKRVEFKHAIAVQYQEDDEAVTAVFCSDKPLKTTKFKKGDPDNISLYELTGFESAAALAMHMREGSASLNCSIGGYSISISSTKFKFAFAVEDGRLKGTVALPEPEEAFDKELQFEVSLDLPRDSAELPAVPKVEPGELTDSEDYDLPLPGHRTSTEEIGTPYRSTLTAQFSATLDQTVKFYRKQLPLKKYVENVKAARIGKNSAELTFTGSQGPLLVSIKVEKPEVSVELVTRNDELARQHGIAPKSGMSKLLLGNSTQAPASVVVDGKTHQLKAHEGMEDPKSAQKIELKPGKHTIVIKAAGQPSRTETLDIPANGTWGLLVGEEFDFSELFY